MSTKPINFTRVQSGWFFKEDRKYQRHLYNKPIAIINDGSSSLIKLETSVTDNARVVIYDRHMLKTQTTDAQSIS